VISADVPEKALIVERPPAHTLPTALQTSSHRCMIQFGVVDLDLRRTHRPLQMLFTINLACMKFRTGSHQPRRQLLRYFRKYAMRRRIDYSEFNITRSAYH
jgi:hypothetical protein